MAGEYDPYSQHAYTLSSPISNFDKSLHPVSSSLKMGRFIFIWVSSQCLLPLLEHLDPSKQSEWDDIEDTMDIKLLSLSKPWSGEGGNLGD